MNGLEAATAIRALNLPVHPVQILVTGFGLDEIPQSAIKEVIDAILHKPVSASALQDVLADLFEFVPDSDLSMYLPAADDTVSPQLAGARVLLVEDNEINQMIASEMLTDGGLHVDIAENGVIATQMMAPGRYDLVLMDMQMPEMDGPTATRIIRAMPGCKILPIIAMTANISMADRELCLNSGMNDVITKPFEPEDFWQTLHLWLRPARDVGTAVSSG
jgi:two-component system sensor histidine kinase/response regulator